MEFFEMIEKDKIKPYIIYKKEEKYSPNERKNVQGYVVSDFLCNRR